MVGSGLFAAQERSGSSRVPAAALVVADPARSSGEDGVARRVQRLLRHEPDELVPLFSQVVRGVGLFGRVDLGPLQLAGVVDVDRLPLREDVERRLTRLAVAVAGVLRAAEREGAPRRPIVPALM